MVKVVQSVVKVLEVVMEEAMDVVVVTAMVVTVVVLKAEVAMAREVRKVGMMVEEREDMEV